MIQIGNMKTHVPTIGEHTIYVGRGKDKKHMVSPGIKPHVEGWLGNPVVMNQPCIACGQVHTQGGETLLCFSTLLNAKLEVNREFARAMAELREKLSKENSVKLLCWCHPAPCHANVLLDYFEDKPLAIGFTRRMSHYAWMSNMSEHPVLMKGIFFQTAEHAYMWHKTNNEADKARIAGASTPEEAKKIGRTVTLREDWETVKRDVMKDVLRAKLIANPDLRIKLMITGNSPIFELTRWHDKVWGICSCQNCNFKGKNLLGKLWMELRSGC